MTQLETSPTTLSPDLRDAGTFLILGGAGGIGSVLARSLSAAQADCVIAGRSAERLKQAKGGLQIETAEVDASDFDAVEHLVGKLSAARPMAGIVNCVGSLLVKPAHLVTRREWDEVVSENLTTAFATVRAAGKHMTAGGSVVLVSAAVAMQGVPNHEGIAAAKGGVISLVKAAAASYATRQLRFNAVCPGLVRTPLTERITSRPRALEVSRDMHPMGRIGEPEDVASAIFWLLNPANSWVTGQVIGIDGGLGVARTLPNGGG